MPVGVIEAGLSRMARGKGNARLFASADGLHNPSDLSLPKERYRNLLISLHPLFPIRRVRHEWRIYSVTP
jgi:hypothetical protein